MLAAFTAALAATLAVPGCEATFDDHSGSTLDGRVIKVEDGSGYGPVTVAVLDVDLLKIRGWVRSDSAGNFTIAPLLPGRYVPIVYDDHRMLFFQSPPAVDLPIGQTRHVVLPTVPFRLPPGAELNGRVVDSRTGRPVAGAMADMGSVALFPNSNRPTLFSELDGQTGTLNQVTGANGRFRLQPVYFLISGGISTTPELLVTAPGYHAYRAPGFASVAELADTVEVRLEKGTDTKIVTGRLVDLLGDPVAHLLVGLEWTRVSLGKSASGPGEGGPGEVNPEVIVQGAVGKSGIDGRFRIDGVPTGYFKVMAAYPRTDGWVGQYGPGADLTATDSTDAGDIIVVPAMVPLQPAEGETLTASQVALSWADVGGATSYVVILSRQDGGALSSPPQDSTSLDLPDSMVASPGLYTWQVRAYETGVGEISRMEYPRSFVVHDPVAPPLGKR